MGTNECSQPASKSSWDSQNFGEISMVLKWPIFAPGHNELIHGTKHRKDNQLQSLELPRKTSL